MFLLLRILVLHVVLIGNFLIFDAASDVYLRFDLARITHLDGDGKVIPILIELCNLVQHHSVFLALLGFHDIFILVGNEYFVVVAFAEGPHIVVDHDRCEALELEILVVHCVDPVHQGVVLEHSVLPIYQVGENPFFRL